MTRINEISKTRFFEAVRKGLMNEVSQMLKQNKQFLDEKYRQGNNNCFFWATYNSQYEVMELLHSYDIKLCEDTDERGKNVLMSMCYTGSVETVKLLVEKFKTNIHVRCQKGWNCFHYIILGVFDGFNTGRGFEIMKYFHSLDKSLCKVKNKSGDDVYDVALILKNDPSTWDKLNEPNQKVFDEMLEWLRIQCRTVQRLP